MNITETLLRPMLSGSSARPLVTYYDEVAGTRVELSVATLANWAAKTANWLTEEFDVEPGDPVCVHLPAHWQTAGVLLGAWWCGAHVVDEAAGARVAFITADGGPGPGATSTGATSTAPTAAGATAVVALDPLGGGLGEAPQDGTLDYLADAKLAGDEFVPAPPVDERSPALLSLTTDEVLGKADSLARAMGIGAGDRALCTADWSLPDGVLAGLLAPLAAGASLVQVHGADADTLARRRATERATVDIPAR